MLEYQKSGGAEGTALCAFSSASAGVIGRQKRAYVHRLEAARDWHSGLKQFQLFLFPDRS